MARACSAGSSWMDNLPFVLLGLRTSIRADSGCSPSDLLYGSPLRLPGDLFGGASSSSGAPPPASDFASYLRSLMSQAAPMPVVHHCSPGSRVDPGLLQASHVFLRIDAVKKPLVPPYEGPYPVLERSQKTFVLLKRDKPVTVTIDRLKPAVFLPESLQPPSPPPDVTCPQRDSAPASSPTPPRLDPSSWPLPTRYGRRPRQPDRLNI